MRPFVALLVALAACAGTDPKTSHSGTAAPTTAEVEAMLEAANHCTVATDCVDVGTQCPFGCWILVNAAEADDVRAAIDAWAAAGSSSCTYSCANRGEIVCTAAGVCEAPSTSSTN